MAIVLPKLPVNAPMIKAPVQNSNSNIVNFLSKIGSMNNPVGSTGFQQGMPSIQGMSSLQPMSYMPNTQNPMELFGNKEMTIDQFGQKFGLDYSRSYAEQQANVIQKAKQDSYNNQLRQVQSGVEGSVNNIDRNYYLDALKMNQQQVNNGVNAGIEADQELRLAMNRQNAMGDIYRDANNQTFSINDSLGRLEAEKLAYADQLYNDRRQQGYQNTAAYNQLGAANASTFAEYQRNVTNDNRGYALKEAELMGNYIPYEARALVETVLRSKDQLANTKNPAEQSQILKNSNDARIKLASMGVNVDKIGTTSTFTNALNSISGMNKTMAGQNNDMGLAQAIAKETGKFVDPKAQSLINTLLQTKQSAERRGQATQAEKDLANSIRGQLSAMGIDANKIAGANVSYGKALQNVKQLATTTLGAQRQSQDFKNENAKIDIDRAAITNDATKISNDYLINSEANSINRQKNAIDLQLGQYDYQLGLAQVDYQKAKVEVDAAQAEWNHSSSVDKANAKAATNAVTAELMGMNKAEAIASFGKHYKNWIDNGVDVIAVMKALGLDGLLDEKATKSKTSDPLQGFFDSGK